MRKLGFLVMTAAFCVVATCQVSYSQTRKELLRENQKLRRAIDSLQNLIGEEIEISDTTTAGDTINPGNMGFLNAELYDNLTPGDNQDSLLSIYYMQRQMANAPMPGAEDVENANYTSDIPDEVYIENLKKMNSFISLPYNNVVKNYIILYTERMKKRAPTILALSSYYLPIFENIFDSYGLPKELAAMAIIESALNPFAVSSANAKGMWQFIYSAAKQYNLQVDSYIDERFDPEKSCDAAARFLKDSYTIFGDWALAISSYNCGPGNVNKAIKRAGSREFWDIYPYLPKETRGYMPSFVGALYMLKYYQNYNIVPDKPSMPAHVDTFMIHKNLHFEQISEVIGIPVQEIRELNPQYLHDIIPGNSSGMILRLPYNYTASFIDNEKTIYNYKDSWNTLVLENHDNPRSVSRFGIDDKHYRYEAATMLATITYMGFGIPFIYMGQEVGLTNCRFKTIDDLKDPVSHFVYDMMTGYHMPKSLAFKFIKYGARDHARVPMSWDDSINGGFNEGHETWQCVDEDYKTKKGPGK